MLLTITETGRRIETEALISGYLPPVEAIAIGDGAPHANPEDAIALVHEVLRVPISVVERVSAQAVRFHATIPQGHTLSIREVGLILEDGTLYGYLPYESVAGSPLHKHASFSFSFSLAISREVLPPIEVNYNPVDTGEIAENISQQAQQRVNGWLADVSSAAADGVSRITIKGAEQVSAVLSEGSTQIAAIELEGATHVSAIRATGAEQQNALLDLGGVRTYAYESRGDLRSVERGRAVVDGLGLFVWVSGSDEPDDDESCFATQNGRWLLECAHWDVVDAWCLTDDESRDDDIKNTESRWPGRILFGTANSSITTIYQNNQASFTGSVSGAEVGDHVLVSPLISLPFAVTFFARVTASNVVTIYLNNTSTSAQSLSAGTWRIAVIKES